LAPSLEATKRKIDTIEGQLFHYIVSPRLREQFDKLIERINAGAEVDYQAEDSVTFDGDPRLVDGMLASKTLHDEDYAIFKYFDASAGTILDVGANWGYSVGSIRTTGSNSPIISFEVLPAFAGCLARVKELDGGRYDYVISGVGPSRGTIVFLTPTINGLALSALTTASSGPLNPSIINNIVSYVQKYLPRAES